MSNKLIMEFTDMMSKFADELTRRIYKNAPFDRTYKGRIENIKNPRKYGVLINGQNVTVSAHDTYAVGDFVWVKFPRNNSAQAFIVCKS